MTYMILSLRVDAIQKGTTSTAERVTREIGVLMPSKLGKLDETP